MMFFMDEQKVHKIIDAAIELINRSSDSENHTVAAAALTKNGKVITSLNLYHFTGGPCAELALMAR